MPGRFVERLHGELVDRLHELKREAAAIERALEVLDGSRKRRPSAPEKVALDDGVLLDELRQSPGARASVIALGRGWPADAVIDRLKRLEAASVVERDGLGWRLGTG